MNWVLLAVLLATRPTPRLLLTAEAWPAAHNQRYGVGQAVSPASRFIHTF